jgi:hypothetical protein
MKLGIPVRVVVQPEIDIFLFADQLKFIPIIFIQGLKIISDLYGGSFIRFSGNNLSGSEKGQCLC